jgi:hypothetical protein
VGFKGFVYLFPTEEFSFLPKLKSVRVHNQKCACTQYVRAKKMCVWGGLEQTHKTLETHTLPKTKARPGPGFLLVIAYLLALT